MAKFFVADEGDNIFNVFPYEDFDKDGYYLGYHGVEGYHISDFDIVYESDDWGDACDWVDERDGELLM